MVASAVAGCATREGAGDKEKTDEFVTRGQIAGEPLVTAEWGHDLLLSTARELGLRAPAWGLH